MQRLEFVDIAKGIGILIVTLGHFGVPVGYIHLSVGTMLPMFWFVSGYFFSPGKNWMGYLKKRSRQLLLPFIGFNILVAAITLISNILQPGSIGIDINNLPKQFLFEYYCLDGPTWFLLALFWLCIIYYTIHLISSAWVRWCIIIALSSISCYCGMYNPQIVMPAFIDVALTALPFYAIGHELRGISLFERFPSRLKSFLAAIILFVIIVVAERFYPALSFGWASNYISNKYNPVIIYLWSAVAIACLLLLCRGIERAPFIQFIGRHSLLLLCIQQPFYRILLRIVNKMDFSVTCNNYILSIICLTLCILCLFFVERVRALSVSNK